MNPFDNVELTSAQIKGLFATRKKMVPLLKEAQEKLLELPLREIIDPAQGISDFRRFATSEELQRIVMDVFKGDIIVDTKLIREKAAPAVVARVIVMTDEGMVPLTSSTASQPMNEMFGGRAVLVAESRAIRRALRELGLRAEFEIYDEEDRLMKSDAHKGQAVQSSASKDNKHKLEVIDDFEDVDVVAEEDELALKGEKKAPKNISGASEKKTVKKSRAPKDAKEKNVTALPESKTEDKGERLNLPLKEIEITVDYKHELWPDRKKTNYPSVLSKGVDNSRSLTGLPMAEFVQSVLGTERFKQKKAITFRSLKTLDLEKLYQYYVIEKGDL
ncbi:MAG: hypothetical protein CBC55_03590 [Gammaproteobacteria bacterium TMED95]|nr:MAG: hypothetical protein CBC55_03590 [Gammaproteobacteria bacterium TMED95]|tara:strand:- start:2197 stop:3192 length:996 start_codon:yes stop_codon:yes gene_type:complete